MNVSDVVQLILVNRSPSLAHTNACEHTQKDTHFSLPMEFSLYHSSAAIALLTCDVVMPTGRAAAEGFSPIYMYIYI